MQQIVRALIIITLSIYVSTSDAQDMATSGQREWAISAGMSLVGIKDSRLSALTYRTWLPTYQLAYRKTGMKSKQAFVFGFTSHNKTDPERLLNLRFIRPVFSYSYERRVGESWIGGFFNTETLLTFPSSNTGHFSNNPISYTIASSIGPKVSWGKSLIINETERLSIAGAAEATLLSYVIRPAYGHPYPEQYLRSGTFSPTKEGMAWPLAKSGKVLSIGRFQSFRVMVGLSYFINQNVRLGVDFRLDYSRTADLDTSRIITRDVLFTIGYQY